DLELRIEKMSRARLPETGKPLVTPELAGMQAQLQVLKENREQLEIAKMATEEFATTTGTKAVVAIDSFVAALKKQADALRANIAGLGGGDLTKITMELDAAFKAYKETLAGEGKPIPAGIESQFKNLKAQIVALNIEFEKTKMQLDRIGIDEADLAEGRKAADQALLAPFKAEDALNLQREAEAMERVTRDFDDMAEAARAWEQVSVDLARADDEL